MNEKNASFIGKMNNVKKKDVKFDIKGPTEYEKQMKM